MEHGGKAERTRHRRAEVKRRLRLSLLEQIERESFSAVKVETIAEAAGLSRSAFYFYYADKRELLTDATRDAAGQLLERANLWWNGEGEPGLLIRRGLGGVAEVWERNAAVLRTTVEAATYDTEIEELWSSIVGWFVTGTADRIRAEQEAGKIDGEIGPEATAKLLVWGAERGLYQLVSGGQMSRAEFVETTSRLWVRALYVNGAG